MVATTDCVEKSKKVSKPLMEKKRRARINKCLDQLKSLLESYYSTSIRKRKLEKADILELTVKHLRNLQKIQSCAASDFSDYQTGFRSCLANFNRYLLMTDNLSGSERWMLSQLSGKLCRSQGREEAFSTLDSGPSHESQDEARRLVPSASSSSSSSSSGPEQRKNTRCKAAKPQSTSTSPCLPRGDTRRTPETKQAVRAALNSPEKSASSPDTQQPVWRPW